VASARPNSENKAVTKKSMELNDPANVDGKTLMPGKYEVLIDGSKVSFELDGKVVATATCEWKTTPNKSMYDSTTFSASDTLQEMQFAGSNRALEVF
jgi:hypothetical protein